MPEVFKDAALQALVTDLRKIADGLTLLGFQPFRIEDAIKQLVAQGVVIEHLTSDQAYIVGRRDGWDAAYATGLPGEGEAA